MKLTCCIMVKNEEERIERTLNSCRHVVDNIVVLDTGSTDGTQRTISQLSEQWNIPIHIFEEKWIDYAQSRNQLLSKARPFGDYLLLMDANDEFRNAENIRTIIEQYPADAYTIRYRIENSMGMGNNSMFFRKLIIRSNKDFYYRYPRHEKLTCDDDYHTISLEHTNIHMYQDRSKDKPSIDRFPDDEHEFRRLLSEHDENHPDRSRFLYYLGQTLVCLDRVRESLLYFELVIDRYPFVDPPQLVWTYICYICNYLVVYGNDIKQGNDRICRKLKRYLKAASILMNDERMEIYYYYAVYYLYRQKLSKAYKYIVEAIKYPYPTHQTEIIVQDNLYHLRWNLYARILGTSRK